MIAPGIRFGSYDIQSALGAGGMGEVYRARDARLGRDVALKVLPAAVAADADRVARFAREAQVLAALNHPHIAQIYGLEESAGTTALVMELVDGDDLSRRIALGPVALEDALPLAQQIAEALEAAHEQGIVHRDLKPGNIKVRPDGTVKVLDFGLAKALDANTANATPDHSPTITSPAMTMRGVILGTAAYMAPEQAKGRAVDRRADIWAFGCVLYEMLTGARAFDGDDVTEPHDWSRDGRYLLYSDGTPATRSDVWALPMTGTDRRPVPVATSRFNEPFAQFSPDGRLVAYASDESGQYEVFLQGFPNATEKRQVSTAGGNQPRWNAQGNEVLFVSPSADLMSAGVRH